MRIRKLIMTASSFITTVTVPIYIADKKMTFLERAPQLVKMVLKLC